MSSGASVATQDAVYVFGGYDAWQTWPSSALDTIARVDAQTGAVTIMNARLPQGLFQASAVWTGEKAYIFGGTGQNVSGRGIVEYDPATDTVQQFDAALPVDARGASAVWNGHVAYVLGGVDGPAIVRFDPATKVATRLAHDLPEGYGLYESGAWADGAAYVVGQEDILRVDPETGAASVSKHHLPNAGWAPALASDGTRLYIWGVSSRGDEVMRYDAAKDALAIMPGRTIILGGSVAAWAGDHALVFGGTSCAPQDYCNRAYSYAPQAVVPKPSIAIKEIHYNLYRDQDSGKVKGEFAVTVNVSNAPVYGQQLLASPTITPRLERTTRDVFELARLEVGEYRLFYVVDSPTPGPLACARFVADSGNSEFGLLTSDKVCALVGQ